MAAGNKACIGAALEARPQPVGIIAVQHSQAIAALEAHFVRAGTQQERKEEGGGGGGGGEKEEEEET